MFSPLNLPKGEVDDVLLGFNHEFTNWFHAKLAREQSLEFVHFPLRGIKGVATSLFLIFTLLLFIKSALIRDIVEKHKPIEPIEPLKPFEQNP